MFVCHVVYSVLYSNSRSVVCERDACVFKYVEQCDEQQQQVIAHAVIPELPEGLPQQLEALLQGSFEADPARRPTAGAILKVCFQMMLDVLHSVMSSNSR
jgi:hypothetical protein